MVFLLADIAYGFHLIPSHWVCHSWIGSIVLLVLMSSIFGYGYWKYNQKARVSLDIVTAKKLERPLMIVLLSDLHLGYHNRASELKRWINMINKENPDLVLIGGDIIDRSIRPLVHDGMAEMLRQINAPVFACLGNHEYYASSKENQKNSIKRRIFTFCVMKP
ncbi:hypothetical protein SAMN05421544_10782 [Riemerella columbipharyngis]|uniref:Calcineurin-like phosphoesterase domain-containing protein n=2 Tax=Riemerella columbipharyngis TaxID=1071918 RepID=A0A1G7C7K2_9FLAO|nr:hypothetical protein SAMN05421544_10782 [Riemerella columbipharyngis]